MLVVSEGTSPIERLVAVMIQVFPRVLGLMFVWTGIQKWLDQDLMDKMLVVLQFDGFPEPLLPVIARTVIGYELIVGALLILLTPRRWVLALAGAGLVVFIGQLLFLVLSPDAPNYCGCGLLEFVMATQEQQHRQNKAMLMVDMVLLLAIGLTWLQLPDSKPPVTPETSTEPSKENP